MSPEKTLYLDHCATTPLCDEVKRRLYRIIDEDFFGNPSADHHVIGMHAQAILHAARLEIAIEIAANEDDIVFTSGATEANNLILWGHALRYQGRNPQILFGGTEHKSIFETCLAIRSMNIASTEEIPVKRDGCIDLDQLESHLKRSKGRPTLVAVMDVNNEIPARHPIEQISNLCRHFGAFFHCDGVQGFVRERLTFSNQTFGSYVISPHKIYGPKGVGLLILGKNELSPRIQPLYRGGEQEQGLRPGTQNLLAIAGAAAAICTHNQYRASRVAHMQRCADKFARSLLGRVESARLTVPANTAAAGIVNFYIENLDASTLLSQLGNICISKGSACIGSTGEKFSHVPRALGLPIEVQANVLRASFGDYITEEQSDLAGILISEAAAKIKGPH